MIALPASTPLSTQPESALVALAQAGDAEAFSLLYARYERPVYGYLRQKTRDTQLAQDLTQEAFARAWANVPRTRPGTRFQAWLYTIATNLLLDRRRRERVVSLVPFPAAVRWDESEGRRSEWTGTLIREWHADSREEPSAVVETAEVRESIQTVMRQLAPHYRQVLFLADVAELSYAEIARAMGRSVARIKCLLFRARQEFRRRWEWRTTGRPTRKPHPNAIAPEQRAGIRALKGTGVTQEAAARRFGVAKSTVWNIWSERDAAP